MNAAHLHLLVNHLPVLGSMFALAVLAFGAVAKRAETTRVGLVALVLAAATSIVADQTGGGAARALKKAGLLSPDLLHAHTEAANWAQPLLLAAGGLALLTLILSRRPKPAPRALVPVTLVVGLFGAAAMARTAYLGGAIRHTEIRDSEPARPETAAVAPAVSAVPEAFAGAH